MKTLMFVIMAMVLASCGRDMVLVKQPTTGDVRECAPKAEIERCVAAYERAGYQRIPKKLMASAHMKCCGEMLRGVAGVATMEADVTELVYVRDSKPRVSKGTCGFDSHRQHHAGLDSKSSHAITPQVGTLQTHRESTLLRRGFPCVSMLPCVEGNKSDRPGVAAPAQHCRESAATLSEEPHNGGRSL
jgi:hypothetical protein